MFIVRTMYMWGRMDHSDSLHIASFCKYLQNSRVSSQAFTDTPGPGTPFCILPVFGIDVMAFRKYFKIL